MAPAVANPLYMGYTVLYKTMLEDSKRGIATVCLFCRRRWWGWQWDPCPRDSVCMLY